MTDTPYGNFRKGKVEYVDVNNMTNKTLADEIKNLIYRVAYSEELTVEEVTNKILSLKVKLPEKKGLSSLDALGRGGTNCDGYNQAIDDVAKLNGIGD